MASIYPPIHHQCYDRDKMLEVIKHFPLGMIVSTHQGTPRITHTPIIYDDNKGRLITHIDAENPQAQELTEGSEVHLVFRGPDAYISPSIYSTKQLPTWNYIIVHITGKVSPITDKQQIKEFMVHMTQFLEGPEANFQLEIGDPRMDRLIPYIKAYTIEILEWEGKFKLSQDKNENDFLSAKEKLLSISREMDQELIRTIYE